MKKFLMELNINKVLIISGSIALIFVIAFFIWWRQDTGIEITNDNGPEGSSFRKSSLSGIACEFADRRPLAVMMSSDPITRPLSGIGDADLVFEMPVTPGGVTRIMAAYQCEEPKELGSIRSAREDFIPLAAAIGAIYAHWGGEREALKKLDGHIIDNIDAMVYETVYFYRKKGVPQPHNGFTDFEKLSSAIEKLGYDKKNSFPGYARGNDIPPKNILNIVDTVTIDYPAPFNVKWVYDKERNDYKRSRGGQPEIDRNDNKQVEASVVVVMETRATFSNKDYLSVSTVGTGNALIYQNGVKINGRWEKDSGRLDSKLFFYDNEGKEIEFTPGKIWVEIITKN